MTLDSLTPKQRLVLSYAPHLHQVLDALNSHGALRIHELNTEPAAAPLLQVVCRASGFDPLEVESWAEANTDGPILTVHMPTFLARARTLWFGKVRFKSLPDAYLRLEVPLATLVNPMVHESLLVLTSHADAPTLDNWAADERDRLAEECVTRYLRPVILQSQALGFESIALGLRTAMLRLTPTKAAGLLACTVPVLTSGWILSWAQSLALTAPGLKRIEADIRIEFTPHGQPCVEQLCLTGVRGESMSVYPNKSESYWEDDEQRSTHEALCKLTGAELNTPETVVTFLEEVAALLLTHYRARNATEIELPRANGAATGNPDRPPSSE